MAQLKWETEYEGDEVEVPTGKKMGRCPICGCTFFEIRKVKSRTGNQRLRYNTYEVTCINQGHYRKRVSVLPNFSS